MKEGIADKMGNFFQWFAGFVGGVTLGFIFGWKLALVILAVSPLLMLAAIIMTKVGAWAILFMGSSIVKPALLSMPFPGQNSSR